MYCSNCYKEQLERFGTPEASKAEPKSGRAVSWLKKPVSLRKTKGEGEAVAKPRRDSKGAGSKVTGSKGAGSKLTRPFSWTGAKVSAAAVAVKQGFVRAGLATGRGFKQAGLELKDHFPLGLVDTERLEGDPPLTRDWLKLVGIVIGGAVVWTLLVALTHVRNPGFSIGVAALVSWVVVWVMGKEFGVKVGVVTAGLVLVSLAFGELAVQLFYRAGFLIKKLDLVSVGNQQVKANLAFYRSFAFRLILYRMLPAAVLAFLIGWWPLKARPFWVGFEGRSHSARKMPPFKKRAEIKRPGAAAKAGVAGAGKERGAE